MPPLVEVAITSLAGGLTMVLTAIAFWLSYEHLQELAARHGMADAVARSWAWPGTVDLFIVVGELLILRASLARRVDLWAIGLATAGSGGSIALNVAGVGTDATTLDYVVAAVPPVAALLAFGALMRQVHAYLAHRAQTPVTARSTPVESSSTGVEAPLTPVETAPVPVTVTLDRALARDRYRSLPRARRRRNSRRRQRPSPPRRRPSKPRRRACTCARR
ncbi:DUF2637 domain-containing protein [Streptomyces sp. ISL-11]|nr:DUF2637 domain-containing protein [Streptomyces sp. ISL-11]